MLKQASQHEQAGAASTGENWSGASAGQAEPERIPPRLAASVPALIAVPAAHFDPQLTGRLAREALQAMAAGRAYGSKLALQPQERELFAFIRPEEVDRRLREERLNWKLSALISMNERYGAVKIVGSNACNRGIGLPRSRSTMLLFDKLTMQPIAIMDGTEISAARTGAYASIVASHMLPTDDDMAVFLFGAGKVAERVVADLDAHLGPRISAMYIRSRTVEGALGLMRRLGGQVSFPLIAAENNHALAETTYVITASNARLPLFEPDAIHRNAVVLHLGGNETPPAFIRLALEQGTVICDDVHAVCHRGSQSLSLYFRERGLTLSDEAAKYQIRDLWSLPAPGTADYRRPALVTCVGLPVLDLYLTQHVFQTLREQGGQTSALT